MPKKASFTAGTLLGILVASTAIPLGVLPVFVTLTGIGLLFIALFSLFLYLSGTSVPIHSRRFNVYDFHKLIIGIAVATAVIGIATAATVRLHELFEIGYPLAALIAFSAVGLYIAACCLLYAFARPARSVHMHGAELFHH